MPLKKQISDVYSIKPFKISIALRFSDSSMLAPDLETAIDYYKGKCYYGGE